MATDYGKVIKKDLTMEKRRVQNEDNIGTDRMVQGSKEDNQ